MPKTKRKLPRRLKWGVAGCGRCAEFTFIPVLSHLTRQKLNSVFSNDKKRAKYIADKFGGSNYFDNYDDFLKSDIDAVYVSSANAHHYEQVIKAAKAGKHILCEKPLAVTSKQAEEMVKVCEENNVQLSVSYLYRYHPLIKKTREFIKKQMLGKIVHIHINFNIDFPPGNNYRYNKELSGGGALRDLGTHIIDLMRYLGGEIESIDGLLDNVIYKSDVEDYSFGKLKFKESGYGSFNVSFNSKKSFNRIEITGHKGAISIENLIGKKNVSSKLIIMLDKEAKKSFRKRANKMYYQLKSLQKPFLKNETPEVTGYDGLINMKLIEELESNDAKRKVS